jgi:hypothetical protein
MTIMKKLIYSLLLFSFTLLYSCKDESLDPFQLKKVKKGTILALRGTQLNNIYNLGIPGADFFAIEITGEEKFQFDAEFISDDPNSLESFDMYVVKRTKVGNSVTLSRVFLKNVPFSEFKNTSDYRGPWVSVSLDLPFILDKLGLDYTDQDDVATILTLYKFGIIIESDLNLKDGSKILAADIVAQGLFQSDIFYPAQILTYTVKGYCDYDASFWAGAYDAKEVGISPVYGWGPYDMNITQDTEDPNIFYLDNFYDYGIPVTMRLAPSADYFTQFAYIDEQIEPSYGGTVVGEGTYDQCTGLIKITVDYDGVIFRLEMQKKPG